MNYKMEELLPVVGRLVQRYTGLDSTSISYEKAEQLMEAALYCMREAELEAPGAVAAQGTPAGQLYEAGKAAVERKVKKALELYHRLLPEFLACGNPYLSDTVFKGLPEFFRRYDVEFEPQNTILTLDYPVLRDLSPYTGIDKIYEFIVCIALEQSFLRAFPEGCIERLLRPHYEEDVDMVDNLCEGILFAMAQYVLAGKPLGKEALGEEDDLRIKRRLEATEPEELKSCLRDALKRFTEAYCENSRELFSYLVNAADNAAVWMKSAV